MTDNPDASKVDFVFHTRNLARKLYPNMPLRIIDLVFQAWSSGRNDVSWFETKEKITPAIENLAKEYGIPIDETDY